MERLTCENKRCKHEFYSSENKKIVKCPVCNMDCYNMEKIINTDNFLWIETVINNIKIYGKKGVFKVIDQVYPNATTRVRIRQIYNNTINELQEV